MLCSILVSEGTYLGMKHHYAHRNTKHNRACMSTLFRCRIGFEYRLYPDKRDASRYCSVCKESEDYQGNPIIYSGFEYGKRDNYCRDDEIYCRDGLYVWFSYKTLLKRWHITRIYIFKDRSNLRNTFIGQSVRHHAIEQPWQSPDDGKSHNESVIVDKAVVEQSENWIYQNPKDKVETCLVHDKN